MATQASPFAVEAAQTVAAPTATHAAKPAAHAAGSKRLAADSCAAIRHVYNVVLKTFCAHPILASVGFSVPSVFLFCMIINDQVSVRSASLTQIVPGAVFGVFSVTVVAWLLACLAVVRIYPNVLVLGIMVNAALGYWSLVNTVILLFAGWGYFASTIMGVLFSWLMPLIASWLFAADLMRFYRRKLLERIDAQQHAAAVLAKALTVDDAPTAA